METTSSRSPTPSLYDEDLYAWCEEQSARLRDRSRPGVNDGIDYANLAEEIESLGRWEKNSLRSHIANLLLHLLKWEFQPTRRGQSWLNSIANARAEIEYALEDSPSLRRFLGEMIRRAYPIASRQAEEETKLPKGTFPETCAYTPEQIRDPEFLPKNDSGTPEV